MTSTGGTALETALAYHRAWTGGDMAGAMTYVADDVECAAPAGRLEGAEALLGYMGPFARMLTRTELLAAFGDDTTAVLVYDTGSTLVDSAPAAEHVEVAGGRIVRMRLVFEFQAARRTVESADSG